MSTRFASEASIRHPFLPLPVYLMVAVKFSDPPTATFCDSAVRDRSTSFAEQFLMPLVLVGSGTAERDTA